MKNEVGRPVIIAVIVIALLVIGGIAWSVFSKKGGGHSDAEEKYFQEHPDAVAKYKQGGGARSGGPGGPAGSGGSPVSGGR